VTHNVAREIAAQLADVEEESARRQRELDVANEKAIQDQLDAAAARAAERERQRPTRVGMSVFYPGESEPAWMGNPTRSADE
jgi:hypothetical protein